MKFFVAAIGALALLSSTSFGTEPQDKSQHAPQARPDARVEGMADGIRLPARIAVICDKAKGDTAIICSEYESLYIQVEREKLEAKRRLDQLTKGGLVDTLK
jgi:hypothetical protein